MPTKRLLGLSTSPRCRPRDTALHRHAFTEARATVSHPETTEVAAEVRPDPRCPMSRPMNSFASAPWPAPRALEAESSSTPGELVRLATAIGCDSSPRSLADRT
jgi:hypothetical protein